MIANQILGGAIFTAGFLLVVAFPSVAEYQPFNISRAGIFIGFILIGIGLYLLNT